MPRIKVTINKANTKRIVDFVKALKKKYPVFGPWLGIEEDNFLADWIQLMKDEIRSIRDCHEKDIICTYIDEAMKVAPFISRTDATTLYLAAKKKARASLVKQYTDKTFDNNIDRYFNEVKKQYIEHPQNECDDLVFCDENRDIFLKNNLKLVVNCAKRYQNLGMPFDDCDSTFIKECKRVGATLTRELELIKDVKYVVQCEKCGAEIEVDKTVFNHIDEYRTKCCKADLVNKRIIHLDVKEDKNKSIVNCHTNYLETAIQILNNKRNDIKQIKNCADEPKKDEKICEGVLVFEGKSRKINQTCLWRSLKYHYENRDIVKIRIIRDAYPEIYPNAFRCLTKTIQNYIINNI